MSQGPILARGVPGTSVATFILVGAVMQAPVLAQRAADASTPVVESTSPVAKQAQPDTVAEVVVTGSRISRKDYVSESPIVSLGDAAIANTGKVNVETALEQYPQFTPAQDESSNGQASGGAGRATVALRGLGESRTLVLLDGRRLTPSNAQFVADLNSIPESIIENVEVISGGASAVYGSDAVAGVVNLKTRSNFAGLELHGTYGGSFEGDARRTNAGLTIGSNFDDHKGSVLFAFDTTHRDELPDTARPALAVGGISGSLPFGNYTPSPTNLPSQAAVNSVFANYGVAPGTVKTTQVMGFNDNGTLFAQNAPFPNYLGPGAGAGYLNSNGSLIYATGRDALLIVPQVRNNIFTKIKYEITPDITAYAQGMFTDSDVDSQIGYAVAGAPLLQVPVTNPYIPGDLAAVLASRPNPNAPFTLVKRFTDVPPRRWDEDFNTYQGLVGLQGAIPGRDLQWDVYASHGVTHLNESQQAVFITQVQNLLAAPGSGSGICAGGLNPFGTTAPLSSACQQYIAGNAHNTTNVYQNDIEASLTGHLFDLPAGDARFALGADYRYDNYGYTPDASLTQVIAPGQSNDAGVVPTQATAGEETVKEGSAELLLPILKDAPAAQSLNMDLGYRFSHYDLFGAANTYKMNLDWHPVKMLLLRGGYNRAIRAPNVGELFSAPTGQSYNLGNTPSAGDPCDFRAATRTGANAAAVQQLCLAQGVPAQLINSYQFTNGSIGTSTVGNRDLKPEIADTFTVGTVITPSFEMPLLSKLSASIDYYNIKIKDAISAVGVQTSISKCYNEDGSNPGYSLSNPYCELLSRNPSTGILTATQPYENLGGYKLDGLDFEADWGFELGDVGLRDSWGRFKLSSVVGYLHKFEIQNLPGGPFVDYSNTITIPLAATPPLPRVRGLTTVTYDNGPVELSFRWRYLSAMNDITKITNPSNPLVGVPAYSYFDVTWSYLVGSHLSLNGGFNNIANKQPPIISGNPGTTNPTLYDVIGRSFYVGFKATL